MKRNNARFDLSEYLIHFVRWIKVEDNIKVGDNLDDVDLDLDEDTPPLPENWGWDDDIEERDGFFIFLSPFFLLRTIVRQGHIWATWARRGKERNRLRPKARCVFYRNAPRGIHSVRTCP
jgi:hypothetical protein